VIKVFRRTNKNLFAFTSRQILKQIRTMILYIFLFKFKFRCFFTASSNAFSW